MQAYIVVIFSFGNIENGDLVHFSAMKATTMPDYFLDITDKVCPMTFVKTKLLMEKMAPGETAEVRLNDGEPLKNVPRSLVELGQEIIGTEQESAGIWRLTFRKSAQ